MSVIAFPKILTDKLTDEGARALADIFNTVENSTRETTLQIAEERFEKRLAQVETKIEQSKAEVIKWMFIFWVGQAATTIGIVFAFLKH
jgi:lipoate synthase